ncbi:MAG: hypothetical protein U0903_02395 [Planctomycetales bacterium]
MSTSRRLKRSLLFIVPLWLAAVFLSYFVWRFSYAPFSFDSNAWKKYPASRQRMLTDMVAKRSLIGLDKKSVLSLLGDPANDDEKSLTYRVGTDGVIDDWWLTINFENGRVSSARDYPD